MNYVIEIIDSNKKMAVLAMTNKIEPESHVLTKVVAKNLKGYRVICKKEQV